MKEKRFNTLIRERHTQSTRIHIFQFVWFILFWETSWTCIINIVNKHNKTCTPPSPKYWLRPHVAPWRARSQQAHYWPCAIRSCHNRDMPKISSEYAFAHLQWHNLKSIHPTIVKVYIFGKLSLQGIQKWLYFYGRGKSKNIMTDQKLKFW